MKKILISTGGSGGHVIPALTIYEHLKDDHKVFLSSDSRGLKFINKKDLSLIKIEMPKLDLNIFKLPVSIIIIFFSFVKSFIFLRKEKISTIISTGGYMSLPICINAILLKKKLFLFEPNMVLGRLNKIFLGRCENIFCYSEEIKNYPIEYIKKKLVINPILRKDFYENSIFNETPLASSITILIIGGSQGAKIFEKILNNSIKEISKNYNLFIYHQVSKKNEPEIESFYKINNINFKLFNFDENLLEYIKASNFCITRSGAITLSELVHSNIPFLTIPFPYAKDNHQLYNAKYYEKKGCCWLLEQDKINEQILTNQLLNIFKNLDEYKSKKNNMIKLSRENTWSLINRKILSTLKYEN